MTLLLRMSSLLRALPHAWRRHDGAAVFEHVDGRLLDGDAFRASDSMSLDGAPSTMCLDAMPPNSRPIGCPSVRGG